jgi:hypothetical protein
LRKQSSSSCALACALAKLNLIYLIVLIILDRDEAQTSKYSHFKAVKPSVPYKRLKYLTVQGETMTLCKSQVDNLKDTLCIV